MIFFRHGCLEFQSKLGIATAEATTKVWLRELLLQNMPPVFFLCKIVLKGSKWLFINWRKPWHTLDFQSVSTFLVSVYVERSGIFEQNSHLVRYPTASSSGSSHLLKCMEFLCTRPRTKSDLVAHTLREEVYSIYVSICSLHTHVPHLYAIWVRPDDIFFKKISACAQSVSWNFLFYIHALFLSSSCVSICVASFAAQLLVHNILAGRESLTVD